MMRSLTGALGLVLVLAITTGCNRQCFLSKDVFDEASGGLLPPNLDEPGAGTQAPLTGDLPKPPNISSPDRPPRYLSLPEAIAIALENGTVSNRTGVGSGTADLSLITNPQAIGAGVAAGGQSDSIRVLALQPAISGANMEASLSRFDAQYISALSYTNTDELQQGLQSFQNGLTANFLTGILKPLSGGGVAGVTFGTDYRLLASPPTGNFNVLNPSYTTRLTIGIEQPLWRDFGTDLNQLLARSPVLQTGVFPGQSASLFNNRQAVLNQGAGLVSNDGILIARLRFDQQRAEFERNVHALVLNVEVAYWKQYQAYGRLYSIEEALELILRLYGIDRQQFLAGKIGAGELALVRAQLEELRGERNAALGGVLEQERNLRFIVGLPMEDGTRIIPITPPNLATFQPDWHDALKDALHLRPELLVARENLRLAQYNLEVSRNFLRPDLRGFANYQPVGIGTRLDGDRTFLDGTGTPRPNNALQSLASDHFNDYTFGVTLSMPLGYRLEHAAERAARLSLIQSFHVIKDQEQKASHLLAKEYQKLDEWQKLIENRRAERKAYEEVVNTRYETIRAGAKSVDLTLLDSVRRKVTAQTKEYEAIAEYNNTLARFEQAKGTILKFNNVHIAEGALPQCAQVRAVENEKERSRARVLRERPEPLTHPGRLTESSVALPPVEGPLPPPPSELPPPAPLPAAEKTPDTVPVPPRELPQKLEDLPSSSQESVPTLPAVPAGTIRTRGELILPDIESIPAFRPSPSPVPTPSSGPSLPPGAIPSFDSFTPR